MQRHDYLRAEGIESAPKNLSLGGIFDLEKISATDEVRVQFEPAHQRIARAIFDADCFRQTAQTSTQAIAIALRVATKNSDPRDRDPFGEALGDAVHENVHILEAAKDAREAQERRARALGTQLDFAVIGKRRWLRRFFAE